MKGDECLVFTGEWLTDQDQMALVLHCLQSHRIIEGGCAAFQVGNPLLRYS